MVTRASFLGLPFATLTLLLALCPSLSCNSDRGAACPQGAVCDEPGPPGPKPPPRDPGDDVTLILGQGGQPFDPMGADSSGVKTDGGKLIIDPGTVTISQKPVIWVSNSSEGTVSKIDTRTLTEVARYLTGPKGAGNDPSRTTVGLNGDVVVANRSGAGAVRIAGDLSQCKDTNGDGKITTSTGLADVKAWGSDECVLWYLDLPANSYPRAAVFDAQYGLDGQLSTTVYIGTYSGRILYRIDATTGKILKEINLGGATPYGAAIDKNGIIWMYNPSARGLTYVEVNKGDNVGTVQMPSSCAYGIAVDPEGRVWTSGGSCAQRYTPDPMDPSKGKFDQVMVPGASSLRGLAVDAKKTVWIADTSFGVFAVDTDTLMVKHTVPIAGRRGFVGMAIDFDGMAWAISQGDARAYKLDPADVMNTKSVAVGAGPYTYSDMTGFQLRNAAAPTGRFRHTFTGCGGMAARWNRVFYQAEYEGGTSLVISARSGSDAANLAAQPFVIVAQQPPDASPIKLDKLGARQSARLLQLEFHLRTSHPAFTPRLLQVKVGATCNLLQ